MSSVTALTGTYIRKDTVLDISHRERVFSQAWGEHQQIRLLLGEIGLLFAQLVEAELERHEAAINTNRGDLRNRLSDLVGQLRRLLAFEGANGEVAIALACSQSLDAEVSTLTVRREKLERALSNFVDAFADNDDTCIGPLEGEFSLFLGDLANYLSGKLDALRRSLLSRRKPASVSS